MTKCYSTDEILNFIETQTPFQGNHENGSFTIEIDQFSPMVCYSIHNGNKMRKDLINKCALSSKERIYEEDPHTKEFIEKSPIRIYAHDSRYEYDLNRSLDECIYKVAWGVHVWESELTNKEKEDSIKKHNTFYNVTRKLLMKLESLFPKILVFDIHSYNYSRYKNPNDYPIFDLGLCGANRNEFQATIEYWHSLLKNIKIAGYETTVGINQVFDFEGYLSKFVNTHFNNCLLMSTELKKIYCNEKTGELNSHIFTPLKEVFNNNIIRCLNYFEEKYKLR